MNDCYTTHYTTDLVLQTVIPDIPPFKYYIDITYPNKTTQTTNCLCRNTHVYGYGLSKETTSIIRASLEYSERASIANILLIQKL